jgi:hypothetical protein
MSERNQQPPYERPSLSQLAAQGTGEGWECPRCGCCDWRVIESRQYGDIRKRIRACRHCGKRLNTIEVIAEKSNGGLKNTTGSLSDLGIVREDSEHDDADDSPRSDRKQRTRSA